MTRIYPPTHRATILLVTIVGITLGVFAYTGIRYVQHAPYVLGTTDSTTSSVVGTKEFFVPLGTGVNTTKEWTDVIGAAAYIDTRLYGKLKKVTFEASIGVPSGNQTSYVRLYNATDKHPVWYSEMSMSGSGPELLLSQGISLDAGNKLYQVQIKSQLGSSTTLLQSRVHIITQ